MNASKRLRLRPMSGADLHAAHELSQAVGWGHRLEDWQLLFGLGHGVVGEDDAGAMGAIALWWPYGDEFATVGMVIVSPALQGSGMGRFLMNRILSEAKGRRVLLNATAKGLRLYESLGFAETGGIVAHSGMLSPYAVPVATDGAIREAEEADWGAIGGVDLEASGMDRTDLLGALKGVSRSFVLERSGRVAGFGLCRPFGKGSLIGPLVASTEADALALLSKIAAETGGNVRADIPDDAGSLASWLEGAGLARGSRVATMWRPGPAARRSGARIFGLAAQALG